MELPELLPKCLTLAEEASRAVMEIYHSSDFGIETKPDDTPLTRADLAANKIITNGLKQFSGYPIMSEEGDHAPDSEIFWCVDPIDGTKEFIKRNGEFTVNIGLVDRGQPVLGVVVVPAQNITYYGAKELGAFKLVNGVEQPIKAAFNGEKLIIATSRSHNNEATEEFLAASPEHELVRTGSSIKFCLVAEGKATIFPCLGERHLWDTAAADAVLRAAGGKMLDLATDQPIPYNPKNLINANFAAIPANYELADLVPASFRSL